MNSRQVKLFLTTSATVVLSAGLFPAVALAQAADASASHQAPEAASQAHSRGQLGDIIVTARRRNERLQDVPVAITAVTSELLRTENIVKLEDVQRLAPSLAISNSQRGGSSPGYAIRGQRGAVTTTTLVDQAVAVYFAEFNLSRSTGTNQSLFDLESIQVLKGPQGTLFGRNSTGGAILITPVAPKDQFEGYAQVSAGSYDYRDLEGAINVPVSETLAIRAGAKISRRDGYMTNVLNGQETFGLHTDSYRLSIRWTPSPEFESTVIGTHFRQGGVGASAKLNSIYAPGVGPNTVAPAVVLAGLQRELAATQLLGRYEFRDLYDYSIDSETNTIQNNTIITLGDFVVKNIAGFKNVKDNYTNNFTGAAISLFEYGRPSIKNKSFSEELQLQGKIGKSDFILGGYYFRETGTDIFDSNQLNYLVTPEGLAAATPAQRATILARLPVSTQNNVDAVNTSYAVFAHANINLDSIAPGLSFSGGARMTWDKREVTYHNIQRFGTAPVQYRCLPTGVTAAAPPPCSVERSLSSSEPTYGISLNYKASNDLLLYVAHRHGYRTGGFNIVPSSGLTASPEYEPETVDDFEVGAKLDFELGGMRGRFNTAAYYQKYNDIQRTATVFTNGTLNTAIDNAARAHISGGEVEFSIEPVEGLRLSAAYSKVKPVYDEFIDFSSSVLVNGMPAPIDVSDSKFAFIPEDQYSISAGYTLPLPETIGEVTAQATLAGQSSMQVVEINTANCGPNGAYVNCYNRLASVPSYRTLNARISWNNVMQTGLDLAVFATNLTDRYYVTAAQNTYASLGFNSVIIGAPRMFGLELRTSFGASRP